MILNDIEIEDYARQGMISPFVASQIRENEQGNRVISYGLSSFGYDIRIGSKFKLFKPNTDIQKGFIDPKNVREDQFVDIEGDVIIPPNSYVLGHSVERFKLPHNVICFVYGKSTIARTGLIVNCTPGEPEWEGYWTIEISNSTPSPVKVYANEGIAQVVFFQGNSPRVTYKMRSGKYMSQLKEVTHAKV